MYVFAGTSNLQHGSMHFTGIFCIACKEECVDVFLRTLRHFQKVLNLVLSWVHDAKLVNEHRQRTHSNQVVLYINVSSILAPAFVKVNYQHLHAKHIASRKHKTTPTVSAEHTSM